MSELGTLLLHLLAEKGAAHRHPLLQGDKFVKWKERKVSKIKMDKYVKWRERKVSKLSFWLSGTIAYLKLSPLPGALRVSSHPALALQQDDQDGWHGHVDERGQVCQGANRVDGEWSPGRRSRCPARAVVGRLAAWTRAPGPRPGGSESNSVKLGWQKQQWKYRLFLQHLSDGLLVLFAEHRHLAPLVLLQLLQDILLLVFGSCLDHLVRKAEEREVSNYLALERLVLPRLDLAGVPELLPDQDLLLL